MRARSTRQAPWWLTAAATLAFAPVGGGCMGSSEQDATKAVNRAAPAPATRAPSPLDDEATKADAKDRAERALGAAPPGRGGGDARSAALRAPEAAALAAADYDGPASPRARVPEGPTRAWFPETFLFQPLVVTDAAGAATVSVRVPDRLTTWRVLALAHSRAGAQGGAVTSFLGTLPVYADPVVPPALVAGDEVRLPIQLVNTTAEPVTSALAIEASGAELTAPRGPRTVPPRSSIVEYATLRASRPGRVQLRVALGATDAVERSIEVAPAGRPVVVSRSGTLAGPRELSIEGPTGSDPASARARLVVVPGALALLRAELGAAPGRGGAAADAYALLLAGRAQALLAALGDAADPEALRELAILAGQRVIRHARALDVEGATAVAAAALAHPQSPVLARLGERAAALLQREQRPDGTFAGGAGWTLQRVLVATADATRAVSAASATPAARQRAQGVALRAASAVDRHLGAVTDGFTAAAILAAGAARGRAVELLRGRVRAAIAGDADGRWLTVPAGVVRADGEPPGRAEATALAVLALGADPAAARLLPDLGTTLLGSYHPVTGWGDGGASRAALEAVMALFRAPLPAQVRIALTRDGAPVASGTFDRARLRDVLALEAPAPGLAGTHAWGIAADPAVPGLGFALTLTGYVPWGPRPAPGTGLELALPAEVTAEVGRPTELEIAATAPAGAELQLEVALPAGVQIDRPALEALVAGGAVARFELTDGRVTLWTRGRPPGDRFRAKLRAIPTLAGTLQTAASRIRTGPHEAHAPPTTWRVRGDRIAR
jgi:hypothetical protein